MNKPNKAPSKIEPVDVWTRDDQRKLDGVTAVGSIIPTAVIRIPDIANGADTWEVCQQCGSTTWNRYNGHWVCSECYAEYKTNRQF